MSLFTELKATYIQLTGKQVPVGTSTAKLQEMVNEAQPKRAPKRKVTVDKKTGREEGENLINQDILACLLEALQEDSSPAAAMELAMKASPKITRRAFFHTAVEAGINIRTAKNYFDRHHKES